MLPAIFRCEELVRDDVNIFQPLYFLNILNILPSKIKSAAFKIKNCLHICLGAKNAHKPPCRFKNYKSVSYQAAVWLSPAGGDGIESRSSPAPISPTSISISYGDVGPTNDGLHNSNPWNESIGIGNVSYAKMIKKEFREKNKMN